MKKKLLILVIGLLSLTGCQKHTYYYKMDFIGSHSYTEVCTICGDRKVTEMEVKKCAKHDYSKVIRKNGRKEYRECVNCGRHADLLDDGTILFEY